MGAKITGEGTPEIKIEGVDKLIGCEHRVIPDRIELGTFIIAAAITNGELELKHCNLDHLLAVVDRLEEVGVKITRQNGTAFVSCSRRINPVEMTTQPYPGFPTDLQAQLMAMLCLGDGISVVTERIFPDRFLHVGELNRMGAHVRKEGPTAIIQGVKELQGANVMASDLRASAALVLAGLVARGTTKIDRRSLGTGSTAGWLASLPEIEQVDVAEIEPEIVHVARRCAARASRGGGVSADGVRGRWR